MFTRSTSTILRASVLGAAFMALQSAYGTAPAAPQTAEPSWTPTLQTAAVVEFRDDVGHEDLQSGTSSEIDLATGDGQQGTPAQKPIVCVPEAEC